MNSSAFRRLAAGTAALGGLLFTAAPAHAALTSPKADAYALSASALGMSLVAPTPRSTYPGGGTASLINLNVKPLTAVGALKATTSGDPTAGTSAASADVADVTVSLSSLASLSLTAVNATCTATPSGATGSSSIATANVSALLGLLPSPVTIPVNAGPNTKVAIPGLASITLNEQSTDADGVLTVNALHITLLNGQGADIVISHAQCGGAPAVQAVPMISPAAGAGAAGMATVGGVAYLRRRRDVAQSAAS